MIEKELFSLYGTNFHLKDSMAGKGGGAETNFVSLETCGTHIVTFPRWALLNSDASAEKQR